MNLKRCILLITTTLLLVSCSPLKLTTERVIPKATSTALPNSTITPMGPYGYIGLEYPPLPSSITEDRITGMMIWSPISSQDWAIEAVTDENHLMLWLSKTLFHDGNAHFQVSDIVELSSTARDQDIVVSACTLNDVYDSEIVALVKFDEEHPPSRYLSNDYVVIAWRANLTIGKFQQMATTGIECSGETFLGFPQEMP